MCGELAIQKNLLAAGFNVYTPVVDDSECDLVCETKYGFRRVQVKTVTKLTTKSSIEVRLSKHKGTDRIDVLAIYYAPEDIVAYLNWDKNKESVNLAINNAVNNQKKHRRFIYAYSNFPVEAYD